MTIGKFNNKKCYVCGSGNLRLMKVITKKPESETNLDISEAEYYREIRFCNNCKTYNNFHDYDLTDLYSGRYNKSTYNNDILKTFNRIREMPESKSDNKQRVKRIIDFLKERNFNLTETRVLDIGSGLCIFLAELKEHGFKCYCVDPDVNSVEHAKKNLKVEGGFVGKFEDLYIDMKFDFISFNKVLEHIRNPLSILKKAKTYLNDNGFLYIELPDGESALKNGSITEREEFYIDHYAVFSKTALRFLIEKAGFSCLRMGSIHEPSDKYTLYAFLSQQEG